MPVNATTISPMAMPPSVNKNVKMIFNKSHGNVCRDGGFLKEGKN